MEWKRMNERNVAKEEAKKNNVQYIVQKTSK